MWITTSEGINMEELYEAIAERADQMRQHLTDRAIEDAGFRQQLISDPKTVIAAGVLFCT